MRTGNYTPPDCDFNRVVMNFSVVSHGRQYDRLALMYLGDTEVCELCAFFKSHFSFNKLHTFSMVRA